MSVTDLTVHCRMSAMAASDIAAQENGSFEGNCGSDQRAFKTSKMARRDRFFAATKCRLLEHEQKSLTHAQYEVIDQHRKSCFQRFSCATSCPTAAKKLWLRRASLAGHNEPGAREKHGYARQFACHMRISNEASIRLSNRRRSCSCAELANSKRRRTDSLGRRPNCRRQSRCIRD